MHMQGMRIIIGIIVRLIFIGLSPFLPVFLSDDAVMIATVRALVNRLFVFGMYFFPQFSGLSPRSIIAIWSIRR